MLAHGIRPSAARVGRAQGRATPRPLMRRLALHPHPSRPRASATLVVRATTATPAPTAAVTFTLPYRTEFGDFLKIVGEGEVFGAWDPAAAPTMEWGEGDVWSITINLPPGKHSFKAVVMNTTDLNRAVWEEGPNRTVEVPAGKTVAIGCEWGNVAVSMVEAGAGGGAATDPEDVPTEDEATSSEESEPGYSADGEEEGTVVGKMTIETPPAGEAGAVGEGEAPPSAEAPGVNTVGKMTMETDAEAPETTSTPPPEVGKMTIEASDDTKDQAPTPPAVNEVGKMTVEGGENAPPAPPSPDVNNGSVLPLSSVGKMTMDGMSSVDESELQLSPLRGAAVIAAVAAAAVAATLAVQFTSPSGVNLPLGSVAAMDVVQFF